MFDFETEIDAWRRRSERDHCLSVEILEELEAHLRDSHSMNTKNLSDRESFYKALESMGEIKSITAEFEKVDPLISIQNTMKNLIIGSLVATVGLAVGTIMMGANLLMYLHPAELLAVIVVPIGITVSSFGFPRFMKAVSCIVSAKHFTGGSYTVLKRWVSATYATGGLVFVVGLALVTRDLGDQYLGLRISASFSALIYAIVISEFFLRSSLTKLSEHVESRR